MKLQVAIDRVPLKTGICLAKQLDGIVDVVEIGTSLIKDYGLQTFKEENFRLEKSKLLLDLKTIDEGRYEFQKGFETSADILTVMGASSIDTVAETYSVTKKEKKSMFIDLIETKNEKINQLSKYKDAIFGIHHSLDSKENFDALGSLARFQERHPELKKIAVSGGIDVSQATKIAQQGIAGTVIVGSKITKANDPVSKALEFMKVIHI